MTITIAPTIAARPAMDLLLDRLYASPDWQHTLTLGIYTDQPVATFRRTSGPFAGYDLTVFGDDDPDAARIADGVDRGHIPACGLDIDVIVRAIGAIGAILAEGRTGTATLTEVVALRAVAEPWYVADADTRAALRAVCAGRPLHVLSDEAVARLQHLTVDLAALAMAVAVDDFA
ncbi:hypothetical protein DMB42_11725 [Nonomuraea sp. WAC 01424]|uniref:hypothetical protein n=1 Tax=Nonomuraea sp. WAC 01424 TaxID=2203200 RepID=UPI000F7A99B4|nr:hypothetical protein [Nonomuraea sp. WAC 01424]RSN12840.1 hypothetical protein DMB42_11725 [Nonomuraea sp. WAC 01424]